MALLATLKRRKRQLENLLPALHQNGAPNPWHLYLSDSQVETLMSFEALQSHRAKFVYNPTCGLYRLYAPQGDATDLCYEFQRTVVADYEICRALVAQCGLASSPAHKLRRTLELAETEWARHQAEVKRWWVENCEQEIIRVETAAAVVVSEPSELAAAAVVVSEPSELAAAAVVVSEPSELAAAAVVVSEPSELAAANTTSLQSRFAAMAMATE